MRDRSILGNLGADSPTGSGGAWVKNKRREGRKEGRRKMERESRREENERKKKEEGERDR